MLRKMSSVSFNFIKQAFQPLLNHLGPFRADLLPVETLSQSGDARELDPTCGDNYTVLPDIYFLTDNLLIAASGMPVLSSFMRSNLQWRMVWPL